MSWRCGSAPTIMTSRLPLARNHLFFHSLMLDKIRYISLTDKSKFHIIIFMSYHGIQGKTAVKLCPILGQCMLQQISFIHGVLEVPCILVAFIYASSLLPTRGR